MAGVRWRRAAPTPRTTPARLGRGLRSRTPDAAGTGEAGRRAPRQAYGMTDRVRLRRREPAIFNRRARQPALRRVQDLAHPFGEGRRRERLLKKRRPTLDERASQDIVVGVTGHKKHAGLRAALGY